MSSDESKSGSANSNPGMQLDELKSFLLLVFGKLQDLESENLATECVLLEGGEVLPGGTGWIAQVEELRMSSEILDGLKARYKPFISKIENAASLEDLAGIVRKWKPLGREPVN
jgi:hypothetical protein